ncbi:M28 family peptidase [Vulgatibacter sp.]|uniref:M28 family peptidase n=1 Tax=Vulgatibacter sp. TaxID=1971226 RepID=UPI003565578D
MSRTRSILSALGAAGILGAGALIALRGPAHARGDGMPISAESLYATVKSYVEAGPAAEGMPSKDRVRDLIVSRLEATGAKVQVLPLTAQTPAGPWELENVFASFRPEAKDRILLGAHWDTRLWAERDPDPARRDQPITGANDGGSGVAVLLGIADALAKNPPPEGLGVDLAFFDGEEGFDGNLHEWFYGSKDLAERWFRTGVSVPRSVVIVDMVARKGLRIRREGISDSKPEGRALLDQLFAIAKEKGYRSFVDAPGQQVLDDHLPFIARGLPAVDLIDLDDPHWHTHEDTLDKIEPKGMAEVADVVLTWIRRGAPAK